MEPLRKVAGEISRINTKANDIGRLKLRHRSKNAKIRKLKMEYRQNSGKSYGNKEKFNYENFKGDKIKFDYRIFLDKKFLEPAPHVSDEMKDVTVMDVIGLAAQVGFLASGGLGLARAGRFGAILGSIIKQQGFELGTYYLLEMAATHVESRGGDSSYLRGAQEAVKSAGKYGLYFHAAQESINYALDKTGENEGIDLSGVAVLTKWCIKGAKTVKAANKILKPRIDSFVNPNLKKIDAESKSMQLDGFSHFYKEGLQSVIKDIVSD